MLGNYQFPGSTAADHSLRGDSKKQNKIHSHHSKLALASPLSNKCKGPHRRLTACLHYRSNCTGSICFDSIRVCMFSFHLLSFNKYLIGIGIPYGTRLCIQTFDVDRTASAPARCSQHLNFWMDLTVQFVWA